MFGSGNFQGLSFAFPIPTQYTDCCNDGEGSMLSLCVSFNKCFILPSYLFSPFCLISAELPLEFPDGTTPVTCRVCIYDSSMGKKVGVGSLMDKATVPPLPAGSLYMEEVHVKVGSYRSRMLQSV